MLSWCWPDTKPLLLLLFQIGLAMSDVEFGQMSIKDSELDCKGSSPQVPWFELYVQPCIAELLGSAFFIFVGCGSVIENVDGPGSLQPALAHGLVVGLIVAVLGNIR